MRIAGDTLKVPFSREARIDYPMAETLVVPDGQRHALPFVDRCEQRGGEILSVVL